MEKLAVLIAVLVGVVPAGPDWDGKTPVTLSANKDKANGEVLCLTSATTAIGGLVGRRSIVIQNLGPNAIYICPQSTCTASTGIKIDADSDKAFDVGDAITIYCRAATADQVSGAGTRYLEVR